MVKKKVKKKISKKVSDRETKQLIGFLVITGLVFILFFGTYFGVRAQKHFDYEGAEWWIEGEREGWGDLTLYHGRYQVKTSTGKVITNMNLWLRNDPRENNISSEVDFLEDKIASNVIITFTDELMECKGRALIVPQLSQAFGIGLPWTTTSGAVANQTTAENLNLTYATCEDVGEETSVILIQKGEESKVYSEEGCYTIQYQDCDEAIKVSEKLILELIKQLNP
jgi:hypothetical protein